MTRNELRKCLAMQRRIARLCREGKLYGIHSWGVHLSQPAYESLFGPCVGYPGERRRTREKGVEVFCLLRRENGNEQS